MCEKSCMVRECVNNHVLVRMCEQSCAGEKCVNTRVLIGEECVKKNKLQ